MSRTYKRGPGRKKPRTNPERMREEGTLAPYLSYRRRMLIDLEGGTEDVWASTVWAQDVWATNVWKGIS